MSDPDTTRGRPSASPDRAATGEHPEPATAAPVAPAPVTVQNSTPQNSTAQPEVPWRRLLHASRNSSPRTRVVVVLLALVLGFAVSTQMHQTRVQGLESLRQDDLVTILDTVDQRAARLDVEERRLTAQRERLESEQPGGPAAVAAARSRADTLAILAGTVPATGPGIRIVISDTGSRVGASTYLDAVQELRDAGAEAMQVGPVRVVASTSFGQGADGRVTADGTPLTSPVTVLAIGDAQTLSSAMAIPGGVLETVRGLGATIDVTQGRSVLVNALHRVVAPRYARPDSAPSPGTGS